MLKLGKLGCMGCGGTALFLFGFGVAYTLMLGIPGELEAGESPRGLIQLVERDHEETEGWTVQEEVDSKGVRHGDYTVWDDELLVIEGRYENDLEQGLWRYWHPNGGLSQELESDRGVAEGPYHHWHDNGALAISGAFSGGSPTGPWIYWDRRGRLDADATGFYVNGNRIRALTDAELASTR